MRSLSITKGGRISHVQPCPQCGGALSIIALSPVLFVPGLDAARYACRTCGTAKKQTIRRRTAASAVQPAAYTRSYKLRTIPAVTPQM
jgi:hypothetical protein